MSGATDPSYDDVIQFDFSFNEDVFLDTYEIGSWESVPANRYFTISGPNGVSGNNLIPMGDSNQEQSFLFNEGSISHFKAGETYSFTHNLSATDDPLFYLEEFRVEVVPEPAAAGLFWSTALLVGLARKRRAS